MGNVYLHIGITKTGTTSIQNYLRNNHEKLEDQGYFYPKTFCLTDAQHVKLTMFALSQETSHHVREVNGLNDKISIDKFRTELSDVAQTEAATHNCENVILSDEGLCALETTEELMFLKDFLNSIYKKNIEIIVFFRRQDKHAISAYSQDILSGYFRKGPFENRTSRNETLWNYYALLKKYELVFGRKNIKVYIYDDYEDVPNALIRKFFEAINLDLALPLDDARLNQSVKNDHLQLINYFNFRLEQLGIVINQRERIASEFRHALKVASADKKCIKKIKSITIDERIQFMGEYEATNELLRNEFLAERSTLFPGVDADQKTGNQTENSEDVLNALIDWLVEAFLLHIENDGRDLW